MGTFIAGQTIEIITTPTGNRDKTSYTITVNAIDNANNTSIGSNKNVTIIDGITVEQAKELVKKDTLQQYIGTRVLDYQPDAGGVWRIFYYDSENDGNGNGYLGDLNTLYIKRDFDNNLISISPYENYSVSELGISIMKNMNPKWRNYPTTNKVV